MFVHVPKMLKLVARNCTTEACCQIWVRVNRHFGKQRVGVHHIPVALCVKKSRVRLGSGYTQDSTACVLGLWEDCRIQIS